LFLEHIPKPCNTLPGCPTSLCLKHLHTPYFARPGSLLHTCFQVSYYSPTGRLLSPASFTNLLSL
jgi:hypothetical protein